MIIKINYTLHTEKIINCLFYYAVLFGSILVGYPSWFMDITHVPPKHVCVYIISLYGWWFLYLCDITCDT